MRNSSEKIAKQANARTRDVCNIADASKNVCSLKSLKKLTVSSSNLIFIGTALLIVLVLAFLLFEFYGLS